MTDALFVGETDNIGMVDKPYGRSLPSPRPDNALQGFVYYQGPAYLKNAYFTNYEERTWNGFFRPAGAISFRKENTYPTTSQSSVEGIRFGFCDKTEGNFVYNGNTTVRGFGAFDGNLQAAFHDVDGSVDRPG
ncbi:cell surface hyaluronidase-like [Gigantopelta aegis]|uniref:cell surface hyaluronidase-like n=1 Tax=Gigantopelta aegis TaxID=1735272 RepID=UPI001B8887A5|nr:cell surface hyaluronidase-like [Gigantopelta aegis]